MDHIPLSDNPEAGLAPLFSYGRQMWLLGAGASVEANLPLVYGLTEHIRKKISDVKLGATPSLCMGQVVEGLLNEIGETATIESVLDHLADHLSIARRNQKGLVTTSIKATNGDFERQQLLKEALEELQTRILQEIRTTLRWGYVHCKEPQEPVIGTPDEPIVKIQTHTKFIDVLFNLLRAGREHRVQPIDFFTTNYDTLIEDALALQSIPYIDGFEGGAVAYWNPSTLNTNDVRGSKIEARVIKLHGSIDWLLANNRVFRTRILDTYPTAQRDLLIYPQALKYDLTKREPFDSLFRQFRDALNRSEPQVLCICGFGFGDEHINQELYNALSKEGSQLTLVVFSEHRDQIPAAWEQELFWERVYVLTQTGLWRGPLQLADIKHKDCGNWWTFSGMIHLLETWTNARV